MILAWKIILLLIIIISFMGAIADEKDTAKLTLSAICIASILSLTTTFIVL